MVRIQGIKDRISAQPLFTGDGAVPVQIVEQENLLGRMGKGCFPLQQGEPPGSSSWISQ